MLIVEIVQGAVVAVEKLVDRLFFLGEVLLCDGLGLEDHGLIRFVGEELVGDCAPSAPNGQIELIA